MNIIVCFHTCLKYTEEMLFILTLDIIFFWLHILEVLPSMIHICSIQWLNSVQCFVNHCHTICLFYQFQFAKNLICDVVIVLRFWEGNFNEEVFFPKALQFWFVTWSTIYENSFYFWKEIWILLYLLNNEKII